MKKKQNNKKKTPSNSHRSRPIKQSRDKEDPYKDSDADGITDAQEKFLGTNPKKKDSDADGLDDYIEAKVYGTNPLDPDTDKDGISDGDEVKMGRNPLGPGKLKNFFIPREENNYIPHALQPKRLAFYAATSVIVKIIVVGSLMVVPLTAWLTPDVLLEQSKKIVELTNRIRSNLGLGGLTESDLLNQAASSKAEDMLGNQYFSHIGPNERSVADWLRGVNYSYKVAGENLAMGFASAEDVVNGWTQSQTHYNNMIDTDFSEIGVGMISGLYNNHDTTLVAQFFAFPKYIPEDSSPKEIEQIAPVKTIVSSETETISDNQEQEKVLSLKEEAKSLSDVDNTPPTIDHDKTYLMIDDLDGEKNIKAVAYLSLDTSKAEVNFGNYHFSLTKDESEPEKWTGQLTIFDEEGEYLLDPVVMANLTAQDAAGNSITSDIEWLNIVPVKTSLVKQYTFVKGNLPQFIQPLFTVSSIYYKILLVIASIVLLLNIFIQIRKQHPRIILYSLGLIGLLVLFISI